MTYTEEQRGRLRGKRKEQSPRNLWDYKKKKKKSSIHVIRFPGEKKENESEKSLNEIMDENFKNLAKLTPRYIIVKLLKTEDK